MLNIISRLLNEWNPLKIEDIDLLGSYYKEEAGYLLYLLESNNEKHHFATFGNSDIQWLGYEISRLFTDKYAELFKTEVSNCYGIAIGILNAKRVYEHSPLEYKIMFNEKLEHVTINIIIKEMQYCFRLIYNDIAFESDYIHIIHFDFSYLIYSLQQNLNSGMKIVSCLTCKYANENPYGSFNEQICFKGFDVSGYNDKLDILDPLQEISTRENYSDYYHENNYLCNDYEEQTLNYQYNEYNFYKNNDEQKNDWATYYKNGLRSLKNIENKIYDCKNFIFLEEISFI